MVSQDPSSVLDQAMELLMDLLLPKETLVVSSRDLALGRSSSTHVDRDRDRCRDTPEVEQQVSSLVWPPCDLRGWERAKLADEASSTAVSPLRPEDLEPWCWGLRSRLGLLDRKPPPEVEAAAVDTESRWDEKDSPRLTLWKKQDRGSLM